MRRSALIAFAIFAPAIGLAAGLHLAQPAPVTYNLIGVNEYSAYVLDSGLTLSDCRHAELTNNDMRYSFEYCEPVG